LTVNKYSNRVIVAGGRDLAITQKVVNRVGKILFNLDPNTVELVTGMAKGADQIPYRLPHYPLKEFKAEWDIFGRGAGHIRNGEMARYATHLIAFWDGKSKGTGGMIEQARKEGLKVKVIMYTKRSKKV
jgi:hypothetical protein